MPHRQLSLASSHLHVRRRDCTTIWCDKVYEAQDCLRRWKCNEHTGECDNPALCPPTTDATNRATSPKTIVTKASPSTGSTASASKLIWRDKIYEGVDVPRYRKCDEELGTCYDTRTHTP